MTPWLTPHFNELVASFMLIRVFCVVSMPNKLPPCRGVLEGGGGGGATGLLNKGGGSNRLPALVTKQQAVEFPQVLTIV